MKNLFHISAPARARFVFQRENSGSWEKSKEEKSQKFKEKWDAFRENEKYGERIIYHPKEVVPDQSRLRDWLMEAIDKGGANKIMNKPEFEEALNIMLGEDKPAFESKIEERKAKALSGDPNLQREVINEFYSIFGGNGSEKDKYINDTTWAAMRKFLGEDAFWALNEYVKNREK